MKKRLATHREAFEAASPYHVVKGAGARAEEQYDPPPFLVVHGALIVF
jgi:hypothetical protein